MLSLVSAFRLRRHMGGVTYLAEMPSSRYFFRVIVRGQVGVPPHHDKPKCCRDEMGSVATRKKLIRFARVRSAPECALSGRVHTQAKLDPPLRSATKTSTIVDIRYAKAITNCSTMYSIYSFGIRRAAKNKGPDNTACDCMGFYCEALRL